MVSKALEMRFSLAKWSALATAASSLVVDAESSSSESSSSSILTFWALLRSWCWWWWWWRSERSLPLIFPRSDRSAGDAPRWFIALALTLPKASAERIPANDVTTLANVLRSVFQPKAIYIHIRWMNYTYWFWWLMCTIIDNSRLRRPGDETFCPEAESAALAADERSPRKRKLADVKSCDDGDSDFLSPAGFRSDWTAGRWESTQLNILKMKNYMTHSKIKTLKQTNIFKFQIWESNLINR